MSCVYYNTYKYYKRGKAMFRRSFLCFTMLLLVGCQEAVVGDTEVLDDQGGSTDQTTTNEPTELEEEVQAAEQQATKNFTDYTVDEMFTHLVDTTSKIEQYTSIVTTEKTLENGDVKIGGWIDTELRVQNAMNDQEDSLRVHYKQAVHAYETMYEQEGYYVAGDGHFMYNDLTDYWHEALLTDFTQENYFYLRPYDIVSMLQDVTSFIEYNFVDEETVEFFLELDPYEFYATVFNATFYDLEKNIPYFGGYLWEYTNKPVNFILTANLEKGTVEQFIFRLSEIGIEGQGELETYFIQNFMYEEIGGIVIPQEAREQGAAG